MATARRHARIIRWIARVVSGILFFLWGASFVEHLSWFTLTGEHVPPPRLWLLQFLHLLMLAGFVVSFRWERLGSPCIVLGAVPFFLLTAGDNPVYYIAVTLLPVLLYLYLWLAGGKAR